MRIVSTLGVLAFVASANMAHAGGLVTTKLRSISTSTQTINIACPTVALSVVPTTNADKWRGTSLSNATMTSEPVAGGQLTCHLNGTFDLTISSQLVHTCPSAYVRAQPSGTSAAGIAADGYGSSHTATAQTALSGNQNGTTYCKRTADPMIKVSRSLPSGGTCVPNGPYYKCTVPLTLQLRR